MCVQFVEKNEQSHIKVSNRKRYICTTGALQDWGCRTPVPNVPRTWVAETMLLNSKRNEMVLQEVDFDAEQKVYIHLRPCQLP
jgi:hypothetical protein